MPGPKKKYTKHLSVTVEEEVLNALDDFVSGAPDISRAAFVRQILKNYIKEHHEDYDQEEQEELFESGID